MHGCRHRLLLTPATMAVKLAPAAQLNSEQGLSLQE